MQTIIRWAGSKRQLLHRLEKFWQKDSRRYIEPFCGSACLFFHLEPASAVLGDLNWQLITTYRALKHDASLVCECLQRLPIGKSAFYRIRANGSDNESDPQIAARFLYLNRYCFNGIYRTNLSGKFNVPYGPQQRGGHIDVDAIKAKARLLTRATLVAGDFQRVLERVEKGDFVYLDPPFAVRSRRVFTEYSPSPFNIRDLGRLAIYLQELHRRGAAFVVSYADCKEARELFAGWSLKRVRTRRHIAGFAAARRHAFELIATNVKEVINGN